MHTEWIEDPEILTGAERARGWLIGEMDGVFVVQFLDSRAPIVGDAAREFYQTNNSKGGAMPHVTGNFIDESAEEVRGLIDHYADGPTVWLGGKSKSALARMQAGKAWADLVRGKCDVARVTLDLDPELIGRPRSQRPGVAQVVWIGLPEWHPAFRAGEQEIAVMSYLPTTSYVFDAIGDRGQLQPVELASKTDASGFVGLFGWCASLEQAEEEAAALSQAVRAHTRTGLNSEEVDGGTVDMGAGRYGDAEAWGL